MIHKRRTDDFVDTASQVKINTENIGILRADVDGLINHRDECDLLHQEHKKRHDDSMNSLTESNMVLAKSITDMNLTLSKFVEEGGPVIKFWNRAGIAFGFSKQMLSTLVGVALGVIAIVSVYKLFL